MTANRTSYVYVGLAGEKSGESCSTDAPRGPNEPRRQTQCGWAARAALVEVIWRASHRSSTSTPRDVAITRASAASTIVADVRCFRRSSREPGGELVDGYGCEPLPGSEDRGWETGLVR